MSYDGLSHGMLANVTYNCLISLHRLVGVEGTDVLLRAGYNNFYLKAAVANGTWQGHRKHISHLSYVL